ncbi:MAG: iron chelate uptake ABC transporter family permease subunit [Paracoccus sp. (in: a-proteobacteria)]|nr:iron chelate uptake ABC transporter family permease subunit [Paracoccus sp. (in: a-proteobacteria)]
MSASVPQGLRRIGPVAMILPQRLLVVQLLLSGALLALALVSLAQGRMALPPAAIWDALWGQGPAARIVLDIRLPRLLTAVMVGAALAMSGAAMQSVSRNPLGSPDIIGLTTGAATGALIWLIGMGPSALGLALAAVAGGGITALMVLWLSAGRGARGLVLTGFGLGAMLAAVNGVILVRGDLDRVMGAALWLAGSLDARGWPDVAMAGVGVALAGPMLVALSRPLALSEMGDDIAHALGLHMGRLRSFVVLAAVMLAALATGAAGPIPFVALAAPQIARTLVRAQGPALMTSALVGAALVLGADLAARNLPLSGVISIGHVTGILGGVYLIGLLVLRGRGTS